MAIEKQLPNEPEAIQVDSMAGTLPVDENARPEIEVEVQTNEMVPEEPQPVNIPHGANLAEFIEEDELNKIGHWCEIKSVAMKHFDFEGKKTLLNE